MNAVLIPTENAVAGEVPVPAIELKGTTVAVIAVMVGADALDAVRAALEAKLRNSADFFEGEAALIDFSRRSGAAEGEPSIDLPELVALLRGFGLTPVAVRIAATTRIAQQAATLGLAVVAPATVRGPTVVKEKTPVPIQEEAGVDRELPTPEDVQGRLDLSESNALAASDASSDAAAALAAKATHDAVADQSTQEPEKAETISAMVIDRALRSGQRIYAKGRDLVVLAQVNPGAEIIADGSIHCYAALRGRAVAGAAGDRGATIFASNFQAELVSIAGVYKTFETIPQELAGRQMCVRLRGEDGASRIELAAIDA